MLELLDKINLKFMVFFYRENVLPALLKQQIMPFLFLCMSLFRDYDKNRSNSNKGIYRPSRIQHPFFVFEGIFIRHISYLLSRDDIRKRCANNSQKV